MQDFRHLARVGLTALALAAGFTPSARAADALLAGAIKSADGQKLGGVAVSARAENSPITTTVFTDDGGNYCFPALPQGKYHVWAQALSFATTSSDADLAGTQHVDLTLKPFVGDVGRQAPGDELLAALPGDTPDDARMKTLVRKTCTGCHSASFPLQHRFDEAGWTAVLDLMKHISVYGIYKGADDKANASIEGHEKELARYLARARGPGETSMKFNFQPRPSGKAARVVFREYELPVEPDSGLPYTYVPNNGSDWSLGTPSLLIGNNNPHDAEQDLDGNIWFTHDRPSHDFTIGRIDAKTGEYKPIKVNEPNGLASTSHGIIRDQNGTIWFNTRSAAAGGNPFGLAKLDPKSEQITVYVPPMSPPAGSLDYDANGFIWITTASGALRFDPGAEKFTEFQSNSYKTPHGLATVYGIAGDHDGNGWWLDMKFDHVEHGDIASGKTTELQLAPEQAEYDRMTPDDKALYANYVVGDYDTPYPWAQGPRRIGGDKRGDSVWIADSFGGNLARIDIHTMKVELVPLPNHESMQPYHVEVDKEHHAWTNLWSTDKIAEYDPQAKSWTIYELPTRGTESRYMSLLEGPSGLSATIPYWRTRKVAVMTLRSEQDLAAAEEQAR